ncbi:unnamed protein product, partial [Porites evermanni]
MKSLNMTGRSVNQKIQIWYEQPDSKGCESNDIFICNSNEISNAFNEHFLTIGPRLAREVPLTSDEESIYLKNITENYNKFCFRLTTTSD